MFHQEFCLVGRLSIGENARRQMCLVLSKAAKVKDFSSHFFAKLMLSFGNFFSR